MSLAGGAICGGSPFIWKREPAGDLWCFRCRKRLPHEWVLRSDTPQGEPSWYEPFWTRECSACGRDRTEFGS